MLFRSTYSGKIHAQIGGLVIEAMVGDHQKSAYNLGVRSNVEFTNKELHNSSKKSSEFYKKVQDAYDEYMKLFDVLYTIIRGGATMYNVGTTISDIGVFSISTGIGYLQFSISSMTTSPGAFSRHSNTPLRSQGFSNSIFMLSEWPWKTGTRTVVAVIRISGACRILRV